MNAKISAPTIQAAAPRYRNGESIPDLAIEYGCSTEGLRHALKKHYPGLAAQRQARQQVEEMKARDACCEDLRSPNARNRS